MTREQLAVACANYRSLCEQLRDHAREEYTVGSKVHVNNPGRYVGLGKSAGLGHTHDALAVLIPNGNIWEYPLECITKAP